jgi:hypothetical protein
MGSSVRLVKRECVHGGDPQTLMEAVYDVPNGFTSHGVGRGWRVQRK